MIVTRINAFLAHVAAVLFAAAGVMLTYEVIARYFFIKPTIWAAELSQLCLIWGCLLGMAHVLSARQHITVDAVVALLGARARKIAHLSALAVVLVFSVFVILWGWEIFYDSFERGRTTGSLLDLPSWIAELPVPIGFFFLALQCAVEMVDSWRGDRPKQAVHLE